MTNLLVKSLFKFHKNLHDQPPNMINNNDVYQSMQDLSILSYNKFLQDTWNLKMINEEQDTVQDCFIAILNTIKRMWHENYPCNILYTGADTLCVKPIEIFNKFNDFRLFTDHDPIAKENYFNGDVKYFPHSLDSKFWESFDFMIDEWPNWFHFFGYEQGMLTRMMFDQNNFNLDRPQGWVVKQIGFSHKQLIADLEKNQFDHAILHFHSSQNPQFRLQCMQDIWRKIND